MADKPLISADSHFVEPPKMWAERLDARFRDRLPLLFANHSSHRGFNRPRRDRIYTDAEAPHLVGQIARERDDSGLGSGVRNMRDGYMECSDRSDIDDRTVLARNHLGQHLATAEKDTLEINI